MFSARCVRRTSSSVCLLPLSPLRYPVGYVLRTPCGAVFLLEPILAFFDRTPLVIVVRRITLVMFTHHSTIYDCHVSHPLSNRGRPRPCDRGRFGQQSRGLPVEVTWYGQVTRRRPAAGRSVP